MGLGVNNLRTLYLEGSPAEMGLKHGKLLRREIQLLIQGFLRQSQRVFNVPYELLVSQAYICADYIPRPYLDEISGIANGSGVPFCDILALNCVADIDACHTNTLHQCCNFILLPDATSDGRIIHGRNLDFPLVPAIQSQVGVCFVRNPKAVIPSVSVGLAGMVGTHTGMNAMRLTIAEVSSPSRDCAIEGTPISVLLRQIMESAKDLNEAFDITKNSARTSGYNLALADGNTREGRAIEFTRKRCAWRPARDGVLIVDDCCLCARTARNRLTYAAGTFRYARMRSLISERFGKLSESTARELLRDKYDGATGRHNGRTYNCICNKHTIQSVLMLPDEFRLWVSDQTTPAPDGHYNCLDLSALWDSYRIQNN